MTVAIRRGGVDDARQAAELWLRARKASVDTIPAPIHGDDEVRTWFASHVVREHELWVAESEPGRLAGFVALSDAWLEHLYVDPDLTGRGIGSRLMAAAKRERPRGLQLWTFASNTGAQRFYERHGFVEVRRTDGRDNEERSPDILCAWRTEPDLNHSYPGHMLERDGYPPGVPCWVDTSQPDPEAAAAFYGDLLGWEFDDRTPDGTSQRYVVAQLRGRDVAGIGVQPEGAPPTPAWNTYVCVESADAAAAAAKAAGGSVLMEPFDVPGAGRMGVYADPSGAAFCVWQAREFKGAHLVNEPGTWNFSGLATSDPGAAKAFYSEVFGWEASSLGPDAGGGGFWRMPGYGDFLEEREPGTRERMAAVGAPEGFEDAVAWLVPATGSDDAPPQWAVTFSVDDADAIADRAAKLGGKVLAPPVDAPWVRTTVLSDPQGAVFTASKYVPPE